MKDTLTIGASAEWERDWGRAYECIEELDLEVRIKNKKFRTVKKGWTMKIEGLRRQ